MLCCRIDGCKIFVDGCDILFCYYFIERPHKAFVRQACGVLNSKKNTEKIKAVKVQSQSSFSSNWLVGVSVFFECFQE